MNRNLPNDDILYFAGTEKLTEKAQEKFVSYFLQAPGRILEIGCGKGVMLSLLKQHTIDAYGIDLSDTSVKYCQSKGLEAIHTDVLSHIKSLSDNSLGGIFCAHVIEHMSPTEVMELLKHAFRVLKSSGRLIIITPNAKDLRTTERFWLDITHIRPYPEKLLTYLLKREGFKIISSHADQEPAKNIIERLLKTLVRWWFLGYMFIGDLIVIAER